jgi:uncharacterized protein (DUF2141 family)
MFSCFTGISQTVNINVTVRNLKEASGIMVFSLYNNETFFPVEGKEFRKVPVPVQALTISHKFTGLQPGNYAVALFHDRNSDGICNLGLFGIPKEGFGFSNNFKPRWSAPEFKDCKITVLKDTDLTIDLIFR